jgi:riboflavin synthase
MFTGIIEAMGKVEKILPQKNNLQFILSCPFTGELRVDQSLAHNGVCLTVVDLIDGQYRVTAIEETLNKTDLRNLKPGDMVNLERCMPASGRFDGHIVQGHVDTTAVCISVKDLSGSYEFIFAHEVSPDFITVKKGSITVNGVSLTVVDSSPDRFSVHIIPFTFEHTNFRSIHKGTLVNLEFDILGKYVAKMMREISPTGKSK